MRAPSSILSASSRAVTRSAPSPTARIRCAPWSRAASCAICGRSASVSTIARAVLRCASRDLPRDRGAGQDRARIGHRVAPGAVAERRHHDVIRGGRDRRVVADADRRGHGARARAPRRARGSSRASCPRARCRCRRRRCADRARHRAPAAASDRARARSSRSASPSSAATASAPCSEVPQPVTTIGSPAFAARRDGRQRSRPRRPRLAIGSASPALGLDHLLHDPRRPVAQLGVALAVPAEIGGDHASSGGCSSVATATRFQALMAMITPIRLPSSSLAELGGGGLVDVVGHAALRQPRHRIGERECGALALVEERALAPGRDREDAAVVPRRPSARRRSACRRRTRSR